MLQVFYPKAYVSSLADIPPEFFHKKGIKGLVLDLDNTIIPWKAGFFDPATVSLLDGYRQSGLKLCVLSNAFNRRVSGLLEPLNIPAVAMARKPSRGAFARALEILGTAPHETAVIGDQIFTDVFGGNRLGLFTVLVIPISRKEFIGTRFVRMAEKILLHRLAKKGVIDFPR